MLVSALPFGCLVGHTQHHNLLACLTHNLRLGLINNVLYVIILSAALDLVGPNIPKSAVLLFDVIPSFLVKLTAPYYIHNVPYSLRILVFVALSTAGMLLIALTPSSVAHGHDAPHAPSTPGTAEVLVKMTGVVLASLSSGGGELSFLGLTHFYGPFSLAAWGSGTGGAGLVGAGAYLVATTTIGLSVRTSLLAFSFLPIVMLSSFFALLPKDQMKLQHGHKGTYQAIPEAGEDREGVPRGAAQEGLLDQQLDDDYASIPARHTTRRGTLTQSLQSFRAKLQRARCLFFP